MGPSWVTECLVDNPVPAVTTFNGLERGGLPCGDLPGSEFLRSMDVDDDFLPPLGVGVVL